MSQPAPKRHDYDDLQATELQRWPGVTWTRELRGKHYALVLTFHGLSRFVIYPCSPGDTIRGGLNHLRDVRSALKTIGATRLVEPKSTKPRRERNRTDAGPQLVISAQADTRLGKDPFAALASMTFAEPEAPRLTLWARVKAYFVRKPA